MGVEQVIQRDFVPVAQCQCAVQQVFQLAHVARKRVPVQPLQCIGVQGNGVLAAFAANAPHQGVGQGGQVIAALPQGGQADFNHVEAVIQVLAEALLGHGLHQIVVGGAQNAHIHLFFLHTAQRAHLALLNHPQQLGLHGQGQVANFIQKQRAPPCGGEVAFAVGGGSGVRPFAGTEKLGLDQRVRNGPAVHRHQRPLGTVAGFVDGAGHQFFAGARFTQDHHRGHAVGHFDNAFAHLAHGLGFASQFGQRTPVPGRVGWFGFGARRSGHAGGIGGLLCLRCVIHFA